MADVFEKVLADKFKAIFALDRVRYDKPSDANEQEVLFIDVKKCVSNVREGLVRSRVTGECVLFSQADKTPFLYFAKAIEIAAFDLTKDLFFYDVDENLKLELNIVARRFSFVYLFYGQYNPPTGIINSFDVTVTEELDA